MDSEAGALLEYNGVEARLEVVKQTMDVLRGIADDGRAPIVEPDGQALPHRCRSTDSTPTSGRLPAVAFGQQSGPSASAKQVQELLTLLQDAGHTDFRDARGPMGFTQRQAAGKFTRDEVEAFIDRLQDDAFDASTAVAAAPPPKLSAAEQAMRRMPSAQLAAELQRRGWIVIEP